MGIFEKHLNRISKNKNQSLWNFKTLMDSLNIVLT